ncbi:hypothetical protein E2C01_047012 [Portunus trituberculatus]|uniref:Uncharacterized protein n=1 Tax=Portunus trituberculatus TaxID=210409 RepID=A0A5B7G6E6_PORTR|nr:hypothetical protein [Portunus trituberculatus]
MFPYVTIVTWAGKEGREERERYKPSSVSSSQLQRSRGVGFPTTDGEMDAPLFLPLYRQYPTCADFTAGEIQCLPVTTNSVTASVNSDGRLDVTGTRKPL